jgi:NAD(P)-dependent dehydrogenase (short-subunit alcohol dehydrogenase family)
MFLTIQSAAREMIKRNITGSIAMTASMSGSVANKGELKLERPLIGLSCIAYNSSKAAVVQMARNAAAEWGPYGIRVNVSPHMAMLIDTIPWVYTHGHDG